MQYLHGLRAFEQGAGFAVGRERDFIAAKFKDNGFAFDGEVSFAAMFNQAAIDTRDHLRDPNWSNDIFRLINVPPAQRTIL